MEFQTIQEAEKIFNPYLPLIKTDSKKEISYWDEYDPKPKMGEWLLFKHIKIENDTLVVSRPILGLVVGHTIWDMALVLEYVTEWRAWEHWCQIYNPKATEYYSISCENKKVKHIQFWTDNIIVIGHWQHKPSFRELRAALKKN